MAEQRKLARGDFVYELVSKFAPDPKKVGEWIAEIRRENSRLSGNELADYVGDLIVWTYTKQGAALALPGSIPGLGTIVQVSTEVGATSVDLALLVRNQTYLVFALGHCYGIKGREVLIQDALICIGLWSGALASSKSGAIRIGTKVIGSNFKKRFPASLLQAINKKVGTTILTKYGTKRGSIALGKLIPFGVGVVVGGGFNYLVMKSFKSSTIEHLSLKARKLKAKKSRKTA